MNFRTATIEDLKDIAHFHAQSWRTAYTNVLSDYFLEHKVEAERLTYWEEKFADSDREDKKYILLAEENERLVGFICVIGNEDAHYGSLIDNLHVHPDMRGRGLGKILLEKGRTWAKDKYPGKGQYLWVYKNNQRAVNFYEKNGGLCAELVTTENPDGGKAEVWRMIWTPEKQSFWEKVKAKF